MFFSKNCDVIFWKTQLERDLKKTKGTLSTKDTKIQKLSYSWLLASLAINKTKDWAFSPWARAFGAFSLGTPGLGTVSWVWVSRLGCPSQVLSLYGVKRSPAWSPSYNCRVSIMQLLQRLTIVSQLVHSINYSLLGMRLSKLSSRSKTLPVPPIRGAKHYDAALAFHALYYRCNRGVLFC